MSAQDSECSKIEITGKKAKSHLIFNNREQNDVGLLSAILYHHL